MSLAQEYLSVLETNIDAVVQREWGQLASAIDIIAAAILGGHAAYEYLAGHFMPGEAGPGRIGRPDLFTSLAQDAIDTVMAGDVVVMTHQYGVLEQYVNVAEAVRARGATIVAVAPRSDPEAILRTHPSGRSVTDLADIVIDTHIPEGDVALGAPGGGPGSCPTSGVIQALVHWALTCGVAERLAAAGRPPTVHSTGRG